MDSHGFEPWVSAMSGQRPTRLDHESFVQLINVYIVH